jgi:hypothetical protein
MSPNCQKKADAIQECHECIFIYWDKLNASSYCAIRDGKVVEIIKNEVDKLGHFFCEFHFENS